MSKGVRIIGPDRTQLRWDVVNLDSQLPDDHRARLVWAFVKGLDLSEFYDRIKARDAVAGRPATDPRVVLAVWLYATLEGIGSARAIDRLCQQHAAYRWLCGGAPINHDLLATFRRDNAVLLDRLLTQSVTGLIAEKLVSLEELAIDGTKVRAWAGRGSMSRCKSRPRGPRRTPRRKPRRANQKCRSATPRCARCGWPTARWRRRGTCRWRPPMASSWRSIRRIGARTADWRRDWSRRLPSAVAGRRNGCWPT